MGDDVVLQGRIKQVIGVEIETSPLDGLLGSALEQLRCGVAEQLGDVDLFDSTLGLGTAGRDAAGLVTEETGEEIVEGSQAPKARASSRSLPFGEVDLT
jgi:hypothetical protein